MSHERLSLAEDIRTAILAHAGACRPNECCGLIASDSSGSVRFAYPLTNADGLPDRYTVDPDEHFGALMHAESCGWEISGVFHSHPSGPAVPSAVDVERALDPEWAYIVTDGTVIRAFRIASGTVEEIGIVVS